MKTTFFRLTLLLVGITLVGAGCNSGCGRKISPFKSDQTVSSTPSDALSNPPNNQTVSSPITIERIPAALSEAPQKFIIKNEGALIKEIIPRQDTPFTMRVFKQTDKYVYIAGYREGLGGYILFEADPTVLYQVKLENNEIVDLSSGSGLVVEDIFKDDLIAWADILHKKIVVRRINGNFQLETKVLVKYTQFGNVHFSPDGKKFAYAAALGNPDKEAGAVFVVDIDTGKQVLIAETKELNRYFEISGWKNNDEVDYVDRGVIQK
jgi:hypothetical protein